MRIGKLIILIWFFALSPLAYAAGKAVVLDINSAIGPATQDYVQRGIDYAQKQHANLIVLKLNTPGGLDSSMHGINQAILSSPIPVVTYVPSGGRAASAGTFLMYASHLSAMADGSNIGASSPVGMFSGNSSSGKKKASVEKMKAENDAAAYIRSLAQLRGRNADWGELSVRKAASLSASEAKRLKVIDEIANNYPELFRKLDGHKIILKDKPVKIDTKNLTVEELTPDWRYKFLSFLTNPNIAYILLLIAVYGLFFEFSNPGLVLPGVAGIIALLLVLYALQIMPINYAGLALILIGIIFMLFEIYISSFGVIGIGGVIAFILGSVLLFDIHDTHYHLAWTLVSTMSILSFIFFFMVLNLAIRSHKKAIITGKEGLIGSEGIVMSVMHDQTIVRVFGEIWEAKSSHTLHNGQKVTVVSVHDLVLEITPIKKKPIEHKDG